MVAMRLLLVLISCLVAERAVCAGSAESLTRLKRLHERKRQDGIPQKTDGEHLISSAHHSIMQTADGIEEECWLAVLNGAKRKFQDCPSPTKEVCMVDRKEDSPAHPRGALFKYVGVCIDEAKTKKECQGTLLPTMKDSATKKTMRYCRYKHAARSLGKLSG
mmetsp:Transcript_36444/g.91096  ORF Transcript_36444/g.91096 Transcript_36444/m.91096 type:complete len:162 (-) Transcript_36444:744-1229(-)